MDILQLLTSFVFCLLGLLPSAISEDIVYGKTLTPDEHSITQRLIDLINVPSYITSVRQRRCRISRRSASVSDTASCPWYYTPSIDNNRYPKRISNATLKACNNARHCLLFTSTGNTTVNRAGVCTELMATFPVIRNVTDNGRVTSRLGTEKVVVGFTCKRVPSSSSTVYVG